MEREAALGSEELRAKARAQAKQHKNPTAPKVLQQFRSLQDMMEFANGPCDIEEYSQSSRKTARGGWEGNFNDFKDWPSAMNAGRCGWPEGADNIKLLSGTLTDKVLAQIKVPELRHHDEGVALDVERYREGDPDCVMRWEEGEEVMRGQGQIRILVNVCVSAAVDSSVLQARGAAIVALTHALELVGKRVELTMAANTANNIETHFIAKAMEEPVQLDQLAFSAGSADMFRRFMFACWERISDKGVRRDTGIPNGGYGMVRNAHHVDDYDVVLPTLVGYGDKDQFTDPKAAEAWVLLKLKELGVELEEQR
jgi:hypothetical protein